MTPTQRRSGRTGQEFRPFEEEALATAPEEIKADWELKVRAEDETINPVLERYGYDLAAIMEQGTPEEQATFEAPPDVQAAQDASGLRERGLRCAAARAG